MRQAGSSPPGRGVDGVGYHCTHHFIFKSTLLPKSASDNLTGHCLINYAHRANHPLTALEQTTRFCWTKPTGDQDSTSDMSRATAPRVRLIPITAHYK